MDAFAEIGVFTRVVDARSFTAAARSLAMTPSGVSRSISRLERRLGLRLLQRTTRSLSLTDEGAAYYARCTAILRDLEDAEELLARTRIVPRGRLRVDAPTVLSRFVIGPALPGLLTSYPELAIELSVRDQIIDPIAEGIDVTLRMAALRDTELVSRNLGAMRMVFAASPRYLAAHGRPKHPDDLRAHTTLGFVTNGVRLPWRFKHDRELMLEGPLHTNSSDAQRAAAVAGIGIIHVYRFHIASELAAGELETILVDHERPPRPVWALYAQHRASLPKVRVFLEWAEAQIQASTRGERVGRRKQPARRYTGAK
jgi:DNA-binding transcriptional LysR family regulator